MLRQMRQLRWVFLGRLVRSNSSGYHGMNWYLLYSPAALWEDCWGLPFRVDAGSYWFSPVRSEKLGFYALAGIIGEIGLLLAGWDGRTERTVWYGCGVEGPASEGNGLGAPQFYLDLMQVEGSSS